MDKDEFEKDIEAVKSYTADSDYESALSILIKSTREARQTNDQTAVDKYTGLARGILIMVESEYGATRMKPKDSSERHCSFCGEADESKLIAGAEAMICKVCSENVFKHFHELENT